jgi:hypothetical protein
VPAGGNDWRRLTLSASSQGTGAVML